MVRHVWVQAAAVHGTDTAAVTPVTGPVDMDTVLLAGISLQTDRMVVAACHPHATHNTIQRYTDNCLCLASESESGCKCLTCNQKPTGSQFSLLHEPN